MEFSTTVDFLGPILQICVIDLLLSGDNAILIAMACRGLPTEVRRRAIFFGTAAAVVLRVILTFAATVALRAPYLKLIGAVLLLLIAIELMAGDSEGQRERDARNAEAGIWRAVMLIVVADVVMSLDNVIAIAAAAQDSLRLLIFGLLLSVPILVFASLFVARLLDRYPLLVQGGAAMLGWIAGKTAVSDPAIASGLEAQSFGLVALAPLLGAVYVVLQGRLLLAQRAAAPAPGQAPGQAPAQAALRAAPQAPPRLPHQAPSQAPLPAPARTRSLAAGAAAPAPGPARAAAPPLAGAGAAADPMPDPEPAPAAADAPQLRRLSRMDMTIMAGVAVPVLGLLATLIYIIGRAIAAH